MTTLLRPDEVGIRLSISARQVYKLIEQREIQAVRIGNKTLRVEETELQRFINRGREDV